MHGAPPARQDGMDERSEHYLRIQLSALPFPRVWATGRNPLLALICEVLPTVRPVSWAWVERGAATLRPSLWAASPIPRLLLLIPAPPSAGP